MATDTDLRLQRLIDEADISRLMLAFTGALDERDWAAYANTFTPDGVFEILGQRRVGREEIAAGPARDLTRFDRTQHLSANHVIDVDGDTATASFYLVAVHVPDGRSAHQHADIGGRYRCTCRRTAEGWRFGHVVLETWWTGGIEFAIEHAAPERSSMTRAAREG